MSNISARRQNVYANLVQSLQQPTVLSNRLNAKARNKPFAAKCKEHYSKSEIRMTRDLTKLKAWDEGAIVKRAEELAKQIARTCT
jgi:hypothetical protein